MLEELKKFEEKQPEIIFTWKDTESEAEGWVVINSLRGGAAGGGTRMRKGLDLREVISLAKTMEIKFTVSGPPIGGAKSGINFDPEDPRKEGVLRRWFNAVIPLLKHYYGTGGDLNIDEIKEVIPITSHWGLLHPQEGIVKGHFHSFSERKKKIIEQLKYGVSKVVTNPDFSYDISKDITISDMITGYGVAMSVIHFYSIWGGSYKDKKVIIQGAGNVGGAAAFYLAQHGLKIIGITDSKGGLLSEKGFSFEEIKEILVNREKNLIISDKKLSHEEIGENLWRTGAEVFIPAAGSRMVSDEMILSMIKNGLELISCGANVPFNDTEIFLGKTSVYADNNISVIPDFLANCGMARVFAYLMEEHDQIEVEKVFDDVSNTIKSFMEKVYKVNNSKTGISHSAIKIALGTINRE